MFEQAPESSVVESSVVDAAPKPGKRRKVMMGVATGMVLKLGLTFAVVASCESQQEAVVAPLPAPVTEVAVAPKDPAEALQDMHEEVVTLQKELDKKNLEVETLKKEQGDPNRVAALEKDLVTIKSSLKKAQGQRDDMRNRLRTALDSLDAEVAAHTETKKEVVALTSANTENLWVAFTERAKIDVCDNTARKGRENCREELGGFFNTKRHDRFASCVTRERTVPALLHREKGMDVPSSAEPIGVGTWLEKDDWFILYCDPTLPEAAVAQTPLTDPPVFRSNGNP